MKTYAVFSNKFFFLAGGIVLILFSGATSTGLSLEIYLLLMLLSVSLGAKYYSRLKIKSIYTEQSCSKQFKEALILKNSLSEFQRWNNNRITRNSAKLKLLLMKLRISIINQEREIFHSEIIEKINKVLKKD